MPFAAEAITLTTEERVELEQMTQSRTLPAGDVFRARLILMLAEGVPYRSIQERLDTTAPTISRWKERFLKQRVAGLIEIRHPGPEAICDYAGAAGQGIGGDPTQAERWIDSLVLSQAGALNSGSVRTRCSACGIGPG